jgi:hypothetical protein
MIQPHPSRCSRHALQGRQQQPHGGVGASSWLRGGGWCRSMRYGGAGSHRGWRGSRPRCQLSGCKGAC